LIGCPIRSKKWDFERRYRRTGRTGNGIFML